MRLGRSAIALGLGVGLTVTACHGGETAAPRPPSPSTKDAANRFLARYVAEDGRVLRRDQGGDIVSEGQALGMLIAQVAGRPDAVRTIWTWTKRHLQRPDGLLAFHAKSDGSLIDNESAADADTLAAYALLRDRRAGAAGLRRDRDRLASAVMTQEATTLPNGAPVILAGPWARTPPAIVDPSYWMPSVFRELATMTHDARWSRAAVASLSLVDQVTDGGRRLPPDWARLDGSRLAAIPAPSGSAGVQYGLDAARLPVWFATDCFPDGIRLARRWWDVLATSDRTAAIALSLDGHVADAAVNPLPLVAGAAAAKAAGDQRSSAQLRTQAATLAERAPTYYGDAWLALGGALLDQSLTTC